jgi:inner membrane protease subunit 1
MSARFRQFLRIVTPRTIARSTFDGLGVFCAVILTWEHIATIQGSEGPSMYPTFNVRGDFLLISRWYDRGRDIKVGDIVRFNHPSFVGVHGAKRVLGMPGDFVCKDPGYSTDVGADNEMIQVCTLLLLLLLLLYESKGLANC